MQKFKPSQNSLSPPHGKNLLNFLVWQDITGIFVLNFSEIAASLTNLLSIKVKFVWTDDCQLAFEKVKLLLQKSPVLKSPDYEKPVKLIIDSSDVGTGSVLVQEASDGLDHPVIYFLKKFLKYQRNYSVIEKEHWAWSWNILMFIWGQRHSKPRYTLIIIL